MAYTTIDDPTAFFQAKTYTGTGSSNAVTYDGNSDMQPDWLLFKNRQTSLNWMMWDSVRGITKYFYSNLNEAEGSTATVLTAIGSDGFTVGNNNNVNKANENIGHWGWKAGTAFSNDASSTSVGSIDSAGSVNTTAGFSIIGYTGTGSAATVAHGLGVKPSMIFFKNRSRASAWLVYDKYDGATKFLYLDVTDAVGTNSGHFNDTEPTSSVFSVGGANGTNYNGENLIAYCFAEKKGYSHFGTYLGNNLADGSFVYLGFKPAFLIIKITDTQTDGWIMMDNKRNTFNLSTHQAFRANTSAAEFTSSNDIDFLSNGFKCHGEDGEFNGNGVKYVYMAFAENPFVTSKGVPTTAR